MIIFEKGITTAFIHVKEDLQAFFFPNIPYSCFGSTANPSLPQSCKHTVESRLQSLAPTALHPMFPTHHSVYTLSRTLHPGPLIPFIYGHLFPAKTTDVWMWERRSTWVTEQEINSNPPFSIFLCLLSSLVIFATSMCCRHSWSESLNFIWHDWQVKI